MYKRIYEFGMETGNGAVSVKKDDLYCRNTGYGFVTERNRRDQEFLQIPEMNSGFEILPWYGAEPITVPGQDEEGCFLDSQGIMRELEKKDGEKTDGEARKIPLIFKADVPVQGNYEVTVTIKAAEQMEDVMIFMGRRRLVFRGDIDAGTLWKRTFMENICDFIPRGMTECYEDKSLDIAVVASRPRLTGIEIRKEDGCPTVYIAGDSTVTDQSAEYPYAPGTSYCGWGQMLPAFLNGKAAVSNHAHSGLTTETFRTGGHYGIVRKYIKAGDFFFIQFGHNDQKNKALQAKGGYRDNLLRYIDEIRAKGAYPVLVTSLARNTWTDGGEYNDLLEEYAKACIRTGEEAGVPVLDLHGVSMQFIKDTGLEEAERYFYPEDHSHPNDYGGYLMAGMVAGEMERVFEGFPEYRGLGNCVTKGYGKWSVPQKIVMPKKPGRLENVPLTRPGKGLPRNGGNPEEAVYRAEVIDMLIRTVGLAPVNVYNDRYGDVGGDEWYAGAVEAAYKNGILPSWLPEDGKLYPEKTVSREEFAVFSICAYRVRRELPDERPCAYDEACPEWARGYVRASCALGFLPGNGDMDLKRAITRDEAERICSMIRERIFEAGSGERVYA